MANGTSFDDAQCPPEGRSSLPGRLQTANYSRLCDEDFKLVPVVAHGDVGCNFV